MEYTFNTIREVEQFLDAVPKFSQSAGSAANFDLQRMERFCAETGNPQLDFPSVHIAGTNGKGTVCQMLASVYETAGFKTALYTSPHLINVRERFRINGKKMDPHELLVFFRSYREKIIRHELTYFEITTAIAFWYFSKEKADIAIVETGLGGRLDATNIINPLASVITSVGMDHTDILGDSIEQIAAEKAGIIKPGKPLITGKLPDSVKSVIIDTVGKHNSGIFTAEDSNPSFADGIITIHAFGEWLRINATGRKKIDAVNVATVHTTIRVLQEQLPVSQTDFIKGIEETDLHYPNHAHFEKLHKDKEWYFDGAHNVQAIEILAEELKHRAPETEWLVVLSFMKDKLNHDFKEIWEKFPNIRLHEMDGGRAATIEEMNLYIPHASPVSDEEILQSIEAGQFETELVIFSGSFYFYEKVRRWMGTIAIDYD